MELSDRGRLVIQMTIICGVFELVAVVLRLLARRRTKSAFAADDWLIVMSLVPSFAMLAVGTCMVVIGGAGHHASTLTDSQMRKFLATVSAGLITYSLTMTMAKLSILLLYRRIFSTQIFKQVTLIISLIVFCWGFAAMMALLFQCHPISGMWTPSMQFTDRCINLKAYYMGVASTNMLLDITVLCLPIYMVWTLSLRPQQKIMLSGIFLLGSISCLASLMRIATIQLLKGGDFSYTVTTPYIWSQIEAATAIVCGSLPTYRPLFVGLNLRSLSSLYWSRSKIKVIGSESSSQTPGKFSSTDSRSRGTITDHAGSENSSEVDMDNVISCVVEFDVTLKKSNCYEFESHTAQAKRGSEDSFV